jgi:hypothetical protein
MIVSINCLFLAIYSISIFTIPVTSIGQEFRIDGSISFQELSDTTTFKIHPTVSKNILIKSNRESIYIGVNNETLGVINLIFTNGTEFMIVHMSGCAGRALYRRTSGDTLTVIKPILNVLEHPEAWDYVGRFVRERLKSLLMQEQDQEREACFREHGYMPSTIDEGSYRDFEVLLDKKKFRTYMLLIQNVEIDRTVEPHQSRRTYHPTNGVNEDRSVMMKFLDAAPGTTMAIRFNIDQWLDLSKL